MRLKRSSDPLRKHLVAPHQTAKLVRTTRRQITPRRPSRRRVEDAEVQAAVTAPEPVAGPQVAVPAPTPAESLVTTMWQSLGEQRRAELAGLHLAEDVERRRSLIDGSPSSAVPLTLLQALPDDLRQETYLKLVDLEVAAATDRREMVAQQRRLGKRETQVAEQQVRLAREAVTQMTRWTQLSWFALGFLVVTTTFAMVMVALIVLDGSMGGVELSLVVFVLALFAISPAVLLLLQRPLGGLDRWSPPAG